MYLEYYHLQKSPFHTTPDPEFLFLSPSHKQALGAIWYGVNERKGLVTVIGEVGLGKTTILRSVLSRMPITPQRLVHLSHPTLSFGQLLNTLLCQLGLVGEEEDDYSLINQLHQALNEEHQAGRGVVLFVDEAQNMPIATLKKLPMLLNMETTTEKILQIVLVGQPELIQILQRRDLRQLEQRVAIRAHLSPLSMAESTAYIKHRLSRAGAKGKSPFSLRAQALIAKHARGNPRRLNMLCDNALVAGVGYQRRPVGEEIVREVISEQINHDPFTVWRGVGNYRWLLGFICVAIFGIGGLAQQDSLMGFVKDFTLPVWGKQEMRWMTSRSGEKLFVEQRPVIDYSPYSVSSVMDLSMDEGGVGKEDDGRRKVSENFEIHVVEEGDTLHSLLRKRYGHVRPEVLQEVLRLNVGLDDASKIFPGQEIRFPSRQTWGVDLALLENRP